VLAQPLLRTSSSTPPDLRLPCPPHVWDEEGPDDHRKRLHRPIDRPLPERRRQPPRLGVDDQFKQDRRVGDDDSRDERNVRTQVGDEREGQKLEQQGSREWAPANANRTPAIVASTAAESLQVKRWRSGCRAWAHAPMSTDRFGSALAIESRAHGEQQHSGQVRQGEEPCEHPEQDQAPAMWGDCKTRDRNQSRPRASGPTGRLDGLQTNTALAQKRRG
jgi:hypothetical protein